MKNRTIVLDTSALIAGFDPMLIPEIQYTVPEVKNELSPGSMSWMRFNVALENKKVKIRKPRASFSKDTREVSKQVGDMLFLSEADLQVLSLALELKEEGLNPLIVSDDYSIQNVSNKIGINFTSLMTFGIKLRFQWVLYCPACYRKYPSDYKTKVCKICGTEIKRKPKKKFRL